MQKIVPHLWFDNQAQEAAEFYISVFPNSRLTSTQVFPDTPGGDTTIVSFEINGFQFMAMSAGPEFKINQSISFMINFDPSQDVNASENLEQIWKKLMEGGKALMPLDKYDFSDKYGWVEDKFGVSWQLILTNPEGEVRPYIVPSFLFTGEVYGKAEEAADFYISVFKNAKRGTIAKYPGGMEHDKEGNIMFTDFMLENQWFAAMESGYEHKFQFNEAVSLMVFCKNQEEIDYYWEKLSAVPESEVCGWLKDKYGVSWQIVPKELGRMMSEGTPDQIARITQAILSMKKIVISELEKAFNSSEG